MNDEHDTTTLTQAIQTFYDAFRDKEAAPLERLIAPKMSYGHSSGHTEGRDEFIANVLKPNKGWRSLLVENQTNLISGDTAISRHIMTGVRERDGIPSPFNMDVMMVWQKQDGAWKLLARQAYRV